MPSSRFMTGLILVVLTACWWVAVVGIIRSTNTPLQGSSVTVPSGFAINVSAGTTTTPADTTTYFTGCIPSAVPSSTSTLVRCYIPRTGTINRIFILFQAGTIGSSETSTINFRLNDTTDTVITALVTNDATTTAYNNQALAIAVVAGDFFELKWVTPTWATNPLTIRFGAVVYIQ